MTKPRRNLTRKPTDFTLRHRPVIALVGVTFGVALISGCAVTPSTVQVGASAKDSGAVTTTTTTTTATAPTTSVSGKRLTPRELPTFPPTPALEAAAALPVEKRAPFGERDGKPLGWTAPLITTADLNATPVFTDSGTLLGIYVSNAGIVARERYEAPGFDAEAYAREVLGDRYDVLVEVAGSTQ